MSPTTTGAMASGSDAASIRTFAAAILHGDDEHRAWLTEAAEAHIAGTPMPPPRGKGTQAAALAAPAPVVPEGLRALSEAATPGTLYTVDQPWGDGTWIVAGNPDPHKGFAVADCTGMFDRENERLDAPEAIRDVGAADDAAFLAAAANHVRTLLAATPSKPVGDGGEASAPPAGGGAVDLEAAAEIVSAAYYDAMIGQVPHTHGWAGKPESFKKNVRARMAGALRAAGFAAAPAAPEPAAGGEREIVRNIPDDLRRLNEAAAPGLWEHRAMMSDMGSEWRERFITDGNGNLADSVDPEEAEFIVALVNWFRSILSAPTGAETAGGDGLLVSGRAGSRLAPWMMSGDDNAVVDQLMRRTPDDVAQVFFPTKQRVVDPIRRTYSTEAPPREQRLLAELLRRLRPEPTPANAGAEGGRSHDR